MKLKYNFIVRNVGGKPVAVAVGQDNKKFNGMIKLNASGEVIFRLLAEDITEEALLARFAEQFDISKETAKPAVMAFLGQLRDNGLLDE
jgi:hypothetical protein